MRDSSLFSSAVERPGCQLEVKNRPVPRQTIGAYPEGGGSYTREARCERQSFWRAKMTDYVLIVTVEISA
jgi:hypothetical protein